MSLQNIIQKLPGFRHFLSKPGFFWRGGGCVDIRDEDAVQNLVKQIRPDVIFHLAWDLNDLEGCIVAGTKNLLRARNEYCSTSRFIFISTDAVFDGERGLYRESDVPAPIGRMAWPKERLRLIHWLLAAQW